MSQRDAQLTRPFGDDEYPFRLAIKQLIELQEKRDAGPFRIFRNMAAGDWYVEDLQEVIRLGLIGGGMSASQAVPLVKRYVDDQPLTENVELAMAVLGLALFGPEEEEPGKPTAGEGKSTRSRGRKSASPNSTATAP